MINKKVTSEVAVGAILLIAIVVGGIFWMQSREVKIKNLQPINSTQELQVVQNHSVNQSVPNIRVPAGWKLYKHDVLGIEFIYPETWGKPETYPNSVVTKLDGIADEFNDETNSNYDSVTIKFSNNDNELNYRVPEIRMFGDKYKGEYYPNLYAHQYGYVDNIEQLKKSGSICDYKIDFNTEYLNTLDEVWNLCENGTKKMLIRNKQVFNGETGTVYSYEMKQMGYKKLQNGFFDNMLISQELGNISQIEKDALNIVDFAEQAKTGVLNNQKVSDGDIEIRKDEFAKFVASIQSFPPAQRIEESFENVKGEDPHITTIRKYYWLISTGKLQDAYDMYLSQENVPVDTFNNWYKDVFFVKPSDFKKVGERQYEFSVQYEEHNVKQKQYRVVMDVVGGKIETRSSVEILTKEAVFGDMKAYAIKRNNKNYVVLTKNGTEITIDQGDAEYDKEYKNISDVKFFSDIQFSPGGNYLTYHMGGWEWSVAYVYDINLKKVVFTQNSPGAFSFDSSEKYFVSCASSGFDGTFSALIFKSDDFDAPTFDVLKNGNIAPTDYASIGCEIDDDFVDIDLSNDNWEGIGKDQKPANKTMTYSFSQNKLIK